MCSQQAVNEADKGCLSTLNMYSFKCMRYTLSTANFILEIPWVKLQIRMVKVETKWPPRQQEK